MLHLEKPSFYIGCFFFVLNCGGQVDAAAAVQLLFHFVVVFFFLSYQIHKSEKKKTKSSFIFAAFLRDYSDVLRTVFFFFYVNKSVGGRV